MCKKCSVQRKLTNNAQLEAGAGEFYEHWLYRCTLAFRRRIVELQASQPSPQGVESD
jgi:hypothetical protein